jgi:hypothetical protein
MLLFDNGPHRLDESFPFPRILEIDPATKNIVWKYQDSITSNFFSPRISNAQRLPNGNTLINEGWFGRFFEVTATGDVVWEYVNPYFLDQRTRKAIGCFVSTAIRQRRLPGRNRRHSGQVP